jgi:hypothetical protein
MTQGYDIIGDIHGHHESLKTLLKKLGYWEAGGAYRHESRQAIFLGDFIDRGPGQREVIDIVRAMVEAGTARAVMGNHEWNAIAYATEHPDDGEYCRPHSEKNNTQHTKFLEAYPFGSPEHIDVLDWFRTLPLWIEDDGLRVVHACWDHALIKKLKALLDEDHCVTGELVHAGSKRDTWEFEAVETLLKGKEIPLPEGHSFYDKEGTERHHMRVRWWDQAATTYRTAYMGPETARTHIPGDTISGDHLVDYAHDAPPVFLGHYWLDGDPEPLAPNIACLDYSVAKAGGKLVAYCWDGERALSKACYVSVPRVEK